MHDLDSLELSDLYDLLAAYTTKNNKRSRGKRNSKDFLQSKEMIKKLQSEIQLRNLKADVNREGFIDGQTKAV